MSVTEVDFESDFLPPLDQVATVLDKQNWQYDFIGDDELLVNVTGHVGNYAILFIWQEELNALQLCAQFDFQIAPERFNEAVKILARSNQNLWMGHFDIPEETHTPTFRHTSLMRDITDMGGIIEDTIDIAMTLCEKHYSAFSLLREASKNIDCKQINLALVEVRGHA